MATGEGPTAPPSGEKRTAIKATFYIYIILYHYYPVLYTIPLELINLYSHF